MRIELNAGGLGGPATISDFQADLSALVRKSEAVVSAFQAVRQQTCSVNGGVGNLQPVVDEIDSRIAEEQDRQESLKQIRTQVNTFVEQIRITDMQVAGFVTKNRNEFYRVNPWAKPPRKQHEQQQNCVQKAWNWICGTASGAVEAVKNAAEWVVNKTNEVRKNVVDSLHKGIANIKSWCTDTVSHVKEWCVAHQDIIRFGVGALVIGGLAVATFLTGGAASVFFAPMIGSVIGGAVGAGVGAASEGFSYFKENGTLKGAGKAVLSGAASGFMTGTVTGAVSGALSGLSAGMTRAGATVAGGMTNAMAAAGVKTVDELLKDGSLQGDGKAIFLTAAISFGFGSYGAYKSYGETSLASLSKATGQYRNAANDTAAQIRQNALDTMRNNLKGITLQNGAILQAQQRLRTLTVLNGLIENTVRENIRTTIQKDVLGAVTDEIRSNVTENIFRYIPNF